MTPKHAAAIKDYIYIYIKGAFIGVMNELFNGNENSGYGTKRVEYLSGLSTVSFSRRNLIHGASYFSCGIYCFFTSAIELDVTGTDCLLQWSNCVTTPQLSVLSCASL